MSSKHAKIGTGRATEEMVSTRCTLAGALHALCIVTWRVKMPDRWRFRGGLMGRWISTRNCGTITRRALEMEVMSIGLETIYFTKSQIRGYMIFMLLQRPFQGSPCIRGLHNLLSVQNHPNTFSTTSPCIRGIAPTSFLELFRIKSSVLRTKIMISFQV